MSTMFKTILRYVGILAALFIWIAISQFIFYLLWGESVSSELYIDLFSFCTLSIFIALLILLYYKSRNVHYAVSASVIVVISILLKVFS